MDDDVGAEVVEVEAGLAGGADAAGGVVDGGGGMSPSRTRSVVVSARKHSVWRKGLANVPEVAMSLR